MTVPDPRNDASAKQAWDATLAIIERLRRGGHVAYLAGGCVRDRLLGLTPKDYDVATNALPTRVCELFPKARLVGAKFGVVLVRHGGHENEVATFRSDGVYSDGRRPDEVTFGEEREDALRRDFTINGLFYDPIADRVIDYVSGVPDLEARRLRAIGDPDLRFAEDHLRMLRAVRLSARLCLTVEASTASAISRLAANLRSISPERIWMELEQILTAPTRAESWRLLQALNLRAYLSSEWPHDPRMDSVPSLRLSALPHTIVDAGLAFSAVLPDVSLAHIESICRSFKLSNQFTDQILWLRKNLEAASRSQSLELADFKPLRSSPYWFQLLELVRVDVLARGNDLQAYDAARLRGESITTENAAPPPLITGDDLLSLGFSASPAMGEILRVVYRAQLNEKITSADQAIALAQELARQMTR